jgi:hypothetical protein
LQILQLPIQSFQHLQMSILRLSGFQNRWRTESRTQDSKIVT